MLILSLNGLNLQILNWLSYYPTDVKSYIRYGRVILTIYLHLPNWMWDEQYCTTLIVNLDMYMFSLQYTVQKQIAYCYYFSFLLKLDDDPALWT